MFINSYQIINWVYQIHNNSTLCA